MKQGACLADKVKTVKKLSKDPMFKEVNKQYVDMRAAKTLLKQRY